MRSPERASTSSPDSSVLYKPSWLASLAGLAIEQMFQEVGFSRGMLTMVLGEGRVGAELLRPGQPTIAPD
ncbi:MAG: hypothetical protein ABGY32_01680 [bacterium]